MKKMKCCEYDLRMFVFRIWLENLKQQITIKHQMEVLRDRVDGMAVTLFNGLRIMFSGVVW